MAGGIYVKKKNEYGRVSSSDVFLFLKIKINKKRVHLILWLAFLGNLTNLFI